VSRWEAFRGHGFYTDLQPLRDLHDWITVYSTLCPRHTVWADVSCILAPFIDDPASVAHVENALTGREWVCSVELWDAPSLVDNVELLSRLPSVWRLNVHGLPFDKRLARTLEEVNILCQLERNARGPAVQYSQPGLPQPPDSDARRHAAPTDPCPLQVEWGIEHEPPGRPRACLRGVVSAKQAESAIPFFRTQSDLHSVLIVAAYEEDAEQAERAKAAMGRAMPNVKIDAFVFSGHRARTD
jgi:hypothetical protein